MQNGAKPFHPNSRRGCGPGSPIRPIGRTGSDAIPTAWSHTGSATRCSNDRSTLIAAASAASSWEVRRRARQENGLDLREAVQAFNAAFAADAGHLEPAIRDREVDDPAVLGEIAGADAAGDGVGAVGILGEDAARKPVLAVIGDG